MGEYNVERFIEAQNAPGYGSYKQALSEIKAGRKESHWIWYIFPQHIALGKSSMNNLYGIKCLDEAKEYYNNDVLRGRLIEICTALYELSTDDPVAVLGIPDAYKMKSCCTLFKAVDPECEIFGKLLEKYCQGEECARTLELLAEEADQYGHAVAPWKQYCPDSYYVGDFNREAYLSIDKWVKDDNSGNVLMVYGKQGIGKKHLLHALFNGNEKLFKNVKFIDGNMMYDLLLEKYISDSRGHNVLDKKYIKTFQAMKYIIIPQADLLFSIFSKYETKEKEKGTVKYFFDVFDSWVSAESKIIFTSEKCLSDWNEVLRDSAMETVLSGASEVALDMPVSKCDKEGIIKKSLILKRKNGVDEKKRHEVMRLAIENKEDIDKALMKNETVINFVRPAAEYTLTDEEMNLVLQNEYESIISMCGAAIKILLDREEYEGGTGNGISNEAER